jgi:uncharacterized membrane protein YedE/YeeE
MSAEKGRRSVAALGAGLLFGIGLVVSGMVDPRNVIAFLDFFGDWNPNLALVMGGAVAVHASLIWLLRARLGSWRGRPLVIGHPTGPGTARPAGWDARLVAGAAIFGIGWGLSGYCPGPAVVSLGFGAARAAAFVAAMLAGALVADALADAPLEATSCASPAANS